MQVESQTAQLSKLRHQRSICAGVTRARVGDETGQDAGLQPFGLPQRDGQIVVAAEPLDQRPHRRHRHAERLRRVDAEAGHALAIARGAAALQPRKNASDVVRRRHAGIILARLRLGPSWNMNVATNCLLQVCICPVREHCTAPAVMAEFPGGRGPLGHRPQRARYVGAPFFCTIPEMPAFSLDRGPFWLVRAV